MAGTIDILPTLAHLAGVEKLPQPHPIDGKDIWPLMTNAKDARSPHEAYYFYWGRHLQAIRSGRWKLHFPHAYRSLGGRKGGSGGKPVRYEQARTKTALFDLDKDIGETTDVLTGHPEIVARLKRLADQARTELGDSARKLKGRGVRPAGQLKK